MRFCWAVIVLMLGATELTAGEMTVEKDAATGWQVYTLRQGATTVRIVPAAGANAYSIVHRGAEYLRVPEELKKLPGVAYGVPILYPMPNRVRGAAFTFEGQTYKFPNNNRGNFIHGLVNRAEFQAEGQAASADGVELTCSLQFAPGDPHYELFPFPHVFRVTIRVQQGSVRWTYEVDNSEGERNLPFGLGLHPYLIYQNSRAETSLQVPAAALMESSQQLPSGKLLPLDGHPLDARTFRSLDGFNADDVYFGMVPAKPARVVFAEAKRGITFVTSADFTHLVVWTPDRPFFGVENQTCSTDAHNLDAQGKGSVAHLQVCPPGKKLTGYVEYRLK